MSLRISIEIKWLNSIFNQWKYLFLLLLLFTLNGQWRIGSSVYAEYFTRIDFGRRCPLGHFVCANIF